MGRGGRSANRTYPVCDWVCSQDRQTTLVITSQVGSCTTVRAMEAVSRTVDRLRGVLSVTERVLSYRAPTLQETRYVKRAPLLALLVPL